MVLSEKKNYLKVFSGKAKLYLSHESTCQATAQSKNPAYFSGFPTDCAGNLVYNQMGKRGVAGVKDFSLLITGGSLK